MKRDLRFEVVYPYPPERVWRALTNRDELAQWLMTNDFEPKLGHKFELQGKPRPGFAGTLHCEVVEIDEPRHLAYKWVSGTLNTVVSFLLEPAEQGGTRLVLEHTGFEGVGGMMISALMAWNRMLRQALPDLLQGSTASTGRQPAEESVGGLIDRYERGTTAFADLVDNIPTNLIDVAPPGEWSARQTALHIVDAEIVGAMRLRMIAAQPGCKLASYRGDVWGRELGYTNKPLAPAMKLFHSLRETTATVLRELPASSWANRAEQEEEGEVTLESYLLSHCEHAEMHMEEIQSLLEKLISEPVPAASHD